MSVFDKVGIKRHELTTMARWKNRAEAADLNLRYELDGYIPYTAPCVLRVLIQAASEGRRDVALCFPNGTPKERDRAERVAEMAMDAGITVTVAEETEQVRRLLFSW